MKFAKRFAPDKMPNEGIKLARHLLAGPPRFFLNQICATKTIPNEITESHIFILAYITIETLKKYQDVSLEKNFSKITSSVAKKLLWILLATMPHLWDTDFITH